VLAAALLVLAASTGCGDDEPSGSGATTAAPETTTATTTTATAAPEQEDHVPPEPASEPNRWAMQVDAACEPVQQQIDALPPPADPASLVAWVEQVLPLVREEVAAVEAVEPPVEAADARTARLFVESLEGIEGALTRYLAALRADDAAAVQRALAEANAAGAQARTHAATLEVTACGAYSGGR
jgi:hypothetical protein